MAYYLLLPARWVAQYHYEPLQDVVSAQSNRLLSDADAGTLVQTLSKEAAAITDEINRKRGETYKKFTPYHPVKSVPAIRWESWRDDKWMLTIDGIPAAIGHRVLGKGLAESDKSKRQ